MVSTGEKIWRRREIILFLLNAELLENFRIVLAESRRRRIDARATVGKGEGRKRDAEFTFNAIARGMPVNNAAGF